MRRSHSSGAHSCRGAMLPTPALLNRVVMPPIADAAWSTALCTASGSVTSTTWAVPSISAATALAEASSMSSTATVAPSFTIRRQVARPIPDPPPVTTALCPSRSPMVGQLGMREAGVPSRFLSGPSPFPIRAEAFRSGEQYLDGHVPAGQVHHFVVLGVAGALDIEEPHCFGLARIRPPVPGAAVEHECLERLDAEHPHQIGVVRVVEPEALRGHCDHAPMIQGHDHLGVGRVPIEHLAQ